MTGDDSDRGLTFTPELFRTTCFVLAMRFEMVGGKKMWRCYSSPATSRKSLYVDLCKGHDIISKVRGRDGGGRSTPV
jgi:hypothetical protein